MRTGLYGETGCRLFGVRECDSSPSIFSQCSLQPSANFARLSQRLLAESCHVLSVVCKARRHYCLRFTSSTPSAASKGAEPQTPNQLAICACPHSNKAIPIHDVTRHQPRQVRAHNNPPRLGQRLPNLVLRPRPQEKKITSRSEALANKHTQCRNHTGMFGCAPTHPHRHAHVKF